MQRRKDTLLSETAFEVEVLAGKSTPTILTSRALSAQLGFLRDLKEELQIGKELGVTQRKNIARRVNSG